MTQPKSLVERLRALVIIDEVRSNNNLGNEAASRIEELERERDEARGLVIEANNSLFGSQSYFASTNGGEPNRHHLSVAIEKLKEHSNAGIRRAETAESKASRLEEENGRLRTALEPFSEATDVLDDDQADAECIYSIVPTDCFAHATIEPRPLAVGDRVNIRPGTYVYKIEGIFGEWAVLSYYASIQRELVPLSDLTRIDGDAT